MAIKLGTRPVHSPVGRMPQPPRSRRADLILLRQGVDIALAYFNYGTREELPVLTEKARGWSNKYYRGYHYAARRATGLLKAFPDLFNLNIEAPLRLLPAEMAQQATHPTADGSSTRDHQRAERKATGLVEPFPEFAEPTLVSDTEMNEIIDLRPRQAPVEGKAKPIMRVDASMLRGSGLMESLPEFLGQLARANLEAETRLANNLDGPGFELDEETAAQQPHVEMNVYAGLVETQRRRHARRVILPGGRPFRLPGDHDEDSGDEGVSGSGKARDEEMADESGNESDASTSTTASLRINLKKRKARQISRSDEEEGAANKLRIDYHHPPAALAAFDMKKRELIRRLNPKNLGPDPFASLGQTRAKKAPTSPARSTSSSSSGGPTRVIKIKVPESMRSSAQSSRAATPDSAGSSPSKYGIIKLRDPRMSPSASGSPQPPSPKISASSPSLQGSDASSESSRKIPRIKLVGGSLEARMNQELRAAKKARPSIEEV